MTPGKAVDELNRRLAEYLADAIKDEVRELRRGQSRLSQQHGELGIAVQRMTDQVMLHEKKDEERHETVIEQLKGIHARVTDLERGEITGQHDMLDLRRKVREQQKHHEDKKDDSKWFRRTLLTILITATVSILASHVLTRVFGFSSLTPQMKEIH